MHRNAFLSAAWLALCAMPMLAVPAKGRAQSAPPEAARAAAPPPAFGNYARQTKQQKLASCMALWDAETHMTKALWKTVCKRLETGN